MATQVLCAWCEAERRAVPSDELERLNHRSALGGMCWTHALTQLLRTRSTPGASLDGRRFLVVVERKSDALFVRLSELLLDEPRIQVIVDRRQRQPRQRLDDWMRQGTQLFGKLVEENEALQQRVRSAEAHSLQVTEMVHELEREITRLRGELDDFKIQRGQVVEAVQSWVGEMGRLTNELLARTKRH